MKTTIQVREKQVNLRFGSTKIACVEGTEIPPWMRKAAAKLNEVQPVSSAQARRVVYMIRTKD